MFCGCFHCGISQENKMREQQEERRIQRERAERARAKARAGKRRSIASCTALELEWGADANELAATLETTLLKDLCQTLQPRRTRASARSRPTMCSLAEQVSEEAAEGDSNSMHMRGVHTLPSRKTQRPIAQSTTDEHTSSSRGKNTAASSPNRLHSSSLPRPRAQPAECPRPQVGETHTLVRGLHSYKHCLTLPPPRTPPLSRCPQWRVEEVKETVEEVEVEVVVVEEEVGGEAQVARPVQAPGAAGAIAAVSRVKRGSLSRRWGLIQANKNGGQTGSLEDIGRKANPLRRLLERAKPDKEKAREKCKEREIDKKDKQREKKEKEREEKERKNREKEKEKEKRDSKKEKEKDKKDKAKCTTEDKKEREQRSLSVSDMEAALGGPLAAMDRLPMTQMTVSHGNCIPRMFQSSMVTTARALRSAVITAAIAAKRDRSRSSTRTPVPANITPVPANSSTRTPVPANMGN